MFETNDTTLLRQLVADRHDQIRRAVGDTRWRQEARRARRQRRRAP